MSINYRICSALLALPIGLVAGGGCDPPDSPGQSKDPPRANAAVASVNQMPAQHAAAPAPLEVVVAPSIQGTAADFTVDEKDAQRAAKEVEQCNVLLKHLEHQATQSMAELEAMGVNDLASAAGVPEARPLLKQLASIQSEKTRTIASRDQWRRTEIDARLRAARLKNRLANEQRLVPNDLSVRNNAREGLEQGTQDNVIGQDESLNSFFAERAKEKAKQAAVIEAERLAKVQAAEKAERDRRLTEARELQARIDRENEAKRQANELAARRVRDEQERAQEAIRQEANRPPVKVFVSGFAADPKKWEDVAERCARNELSSITWVGRRATLVDDIAQADVVVVGDAKFTEKTADATDSSGKRLKLSYVSATVSLKLQSKSGREIDKRQYLGASSRVLKPNNATRDRLGTEALQQAIDRLTEDEAFLKTLRAG